VAAERDGGEHVLVGAEVEEQPPLRLHLELRDAADGGLRHCLGHGEGLKAGHKPVLVRPLQKLRP